MSSQQVSLHCSQVEQNPPSSTNGQPNRYLHLFAVQLLRWRMLRSLLCCLLRSSSVQDPITLFPFRTVIDDDDHIHSQCYNADTRNQYDGSNWCFNFLCLSSAMARNMIREGYGIQGSCLGDIIMSCLCGPCSAVQLRQEVASRGGVGSTQKTTNSDPAKIELIQENAAAAADVVSAGN